MRYGLLCICTIVLYCSCQKHNTAAPGTTITPPVTPVVVIKSMEKYKTTVTTTGYIGLQMSYTDSLSSNKIFFYGYFNADGTPDQLKFFQVVRKNNDTIFNYHLLDDFELGYISYSLKNNVIPEKIITRFTKTKTNLFFLASYSRNWNTKTDSTLRELYINSDNSILVNARAVSQKRPGEFTVLRSSSANRETGSLTYNTLYTANGIDQSKLNQFMANMQAVKNNFTTVFSSLSASGQSSLLAPVMLIDAAMNAGLSVMDLWSLNILSVNNSAVVNYGNAVAGSASGTFLSTNFQDLYSVSPVIIYSPSLSYATPSAAVSFKFICHQDNYENGKFYYDWDKSIQINDTSIFFIDLKSSPGTHWAFGPVKQYLNGVSTSNSIVKGNMILYGVYGINPDWTMDSLRKYYSSVYIYSANRAANAGWGMISNGYDIIKQQ